MSTSIFGYPVPIGTTVYGDAVDTTSTAVLRDGIANGLLHYADSYAQVRVCAAFPGAAVTFNGQTQATIESAPTANQWYLLQGGILGAWPLTQHLSGKAYELRIRLRGKTTNASGSCSFRLVLCPLGRVFEYIDQDVDFVWTASGITSTSAAWLTGQTTDNALANRLVVDSATALSWVRTVSAPEDATTPRSIQQCLVALHVLGRTTNAAGLPQVFGAYAAEYVGVG
jgi:hypothetical protein